jgi:aminoglycoside 6'-N-acetyltransferase I
MRNDDITIRLLANNDAAILDSVNDDVFDNPVRADSARRFLDDPNSMIAVALHDDVVVGMATANVYGHPDKALQLFINEVGVAGAYRRRGLGKKLVRLLLARGREFGCVEAWVATEEDNMPARALYTALNGKEDPSRAVVYTYDLNAENDTLEAGAAGDDPETPALIQD